MPLSRAPRLLWRYLASDVLGILLMACAGLVGVIAFAAAMRPLSEGRVGVFESVRLMGLLAVPMLQFALPFASGLAATLAYHRFAAENEANASMAGGISHRSILTPAIALGLALSILLGLLSHQVIPRFLRSAEQLLTRDVTRFIINPIERGETIRLGQWDLRADRVIDAGAAAASDAKQSGAAEHLVLLGVLAHRVDEPERFIEAGRVDLYLYDDDDSAASDDDAGGTRAVLRFDQANAYVGANRLQAQGVFTDALRIPSAFRDDPKYLDFNELRRVREHPEMLNRIEWRRRLVADHLAMRDMIDDVAGQLREKGKATLLRRGDVLTIHASGIVPVEDGWALRPFTSNGAMRIRVDMKLASGSVRTHTGATARLRFRDLAADQTAMANEGDGPGRVWLRLDLDDVTSSGTGASPAAEGDGGADSRSDTLFYGALTTEKDHAAERAAETSKQLIDDAMQRTSGTDGDAATESPGSAPMRRAARELSTKIEDLKREAVSKLHERAAFSLSCLLMTVCGAVVALRLHAALPLQVYLWSFFPALICVITISAGQGLTHKYGTPGLILLWGGVAGLGIFTLAAYSSLKRH